MIAWFSACLRGGVPVASEVARVLAAPLDVLLVRKLGAPFQPELAIGAVVDGDPPEVLLNEEIVQELDLSQSDIAAETAKQLSVIAGRSQLYGGDSSRVVLEGKCAIVVDDGAATGATLRVALKGLRRRRPRRLIAAVPVASQSALDLLRAEADDVVCLRCAGELRRRGLLLSRLFRGQRRRGPRAARGGCAVSLIEPQAASVHLPLLITTTSRSGTRLRNDTTGPSTHISVTMCSPG